MKKLLCCWALFLPTLALAQFTNVTGRVTDSIGLSYAGGTVVPILNTSASPTLNGLPYTPPTNPALIDSNGNFSMNLVANNAAGFLPNGTTWSFTFCSGPGTVPIAWGKQSNCFNVLNLSISGSTQDISQQISTKATALTYSESVMLTASPTCPLLDGLVQLDSVHLDSIGRSKIQPTALGQTTGIVGVAVSVPQQQCLGITQVATGLVVPLLTDNQSTVGDGVAASSSVRGEGTDIGGAATPTSVGVVVQANVGSGTVSMVLLTLTGGAGTGGGGGVNNCTTGNSVAYYATPGSVVSCDQFHTDDGAGNVGAKSYTATDAAHSGYINIIQGALPPTAPTNGVQLFVPSSVTGYKLELPGATGTGCLQANAITGGFQVTTTGTNCGSGAAATFQTNTVNNASQTLLNFTNTPTITASNPSGGIEQFSIAGAGQLSNPVAPTVTPTGTTGATSYSYGVAGCEDAACTYHSALSPIGSTATGNATLSTSNYNALTAYADTLYGFRGYVVCRTVGGATTGVITNGLQAGKQFNDTGLTGDGTNCATTYAANTTLTYPYCLGSSLPGNPSVPGAPCGVDGPPLSPAAFDDEMTQTYGAPGDVNDPLWSWVNQGSATAAWSNGELIFTGVAASGIAGHLLVNARALPATPFTFVAFVSDLEWNVNSLCGIGLRESSTNKFITLVMFENQGTNGNTDGMMISAFNANNTFAGGSWTTVGAQKSQAGTSFYLKVQDDGTNINFSYSPPSDGIKYIQFATETIASAFTVAPNQLFITEGDSPTTAPSCTFDYERRTQ